jgi:DNA-binding NtrC family response regulator
MSRSRITLVANEPRLANALQTQLKKALGQPVSLCPLEAVGTRLVQHAPALLLLAVDPAGDFEPVLRVAEDTVVRKLPLVILVIGGDGTAPLGGLTCLDAYADHRLYWPEEAPSLVELVRERLQQDRTEAPAEVPLAEVIAQRLLAHTPSLHLLAEPLALTATHDMTVLLTGETGTGKTYLARLIHEFSPRKSHRLLMVPCGALTANLVESEFFGHVKGAFTGADQAKEGKFAAAGNGTLLLDEIDALGLEQQANLLRVIETGEYEPVGSNKTQICTARIIAASNLNLEDAVKAGKFRQDLYYRLNVMNFYLPPLRERVKDIGPLARAMVARFAAKFHKPIFDISPEAVAALETFPWPGNIRQLDNVLQQAVLVCSGPELLLSHLPQPVQKPTLRGHAHERAAGDSLVQNREMLERNVIQRALASCDYSRARAANALGISRVTLYKKMKKYGLMEVPVPSTNAS